MSPVTILDGAMGTLLGERGVPTPPPLWSALALRSAPDVVRAIHAEYARAGAMVHTANTFRTKRRSAPGDWSDLARLAVRLARDAAAAGQGVAGSIAPLEDCYRPDLSPGQASRAEHRELAEVLCDAGVDLLLCETFPHCGEALVAVEEAVRTGLPTWLALTAGPDATLLSPAEVGACAREAVLRGATAVLVNCVPARATLAFVDALSGAGVAFGAYANAGAPTEGLGWSVTPSADAAERYADLASQWVAAGATLVGSCCGTGPAHTAALARRLD